ncbi:MAG: YbgA family protein, partial [Proteobacteria bacterium]|nr:YbgA family protein [Pseudomonadota bacterium]
AAGKGMPAGELFSRYEAFLMEAMALKATPKKHSDVLMHMMGYFKKDLSGDEKRELLEVIEDFRKGLLPLVAPLTLLSHYVRKYGSEYLAGQAYLSPHPAELGLRNHA